MVPNRLPSFVYPTPCKQINYWVVLLLLYLVLGLILYLNYDHALLLLFVLLLCMIRSFGLIGTCRTTRDNSATTRVKWDTLGQLIRKASVRLPYPKRANGE
jgi:hypothetical protein